MVRVYLIFALLAAPLLAWADDPSTSAVAARATIADSFEYQGGPIKVLLLDADNTIRVSTTPRRAPRSPEEVVLLPGVRERLAAYEKQGYFVAIISNQENPVRDTGLPKIDATMKETVRQIQVNGGPRMDYYDFAVKDDEAKPGTRLFGRLEAALKKKFGEAATIDKAQSAYVGDSGYLSDEIRPDGRFGFDTANFDRKFAENCGVPYAEPQNIFGWRARGVDRISNVADLESYENRSASCAGLFGNLIVAPLGN